MKGRQKKADRGWRVGRGRPAMVVILPVVNKQKYMGSRELKIDFQ